jgi:hypothetical protein
MEENNDKLRGYYEVLVQNSQIGASYYLKLKSYPITFTVIPMIYAGSEGKIDGMFIYRVIEPASHTGMFKKPIEDIEMLKRKT